MTVTGNGYAKARMRSMSPAATASARRRSTIASTRERRGSAMPALNARPRTLLNGQIREDEPPSDLAEERLDCLGRGQRLSRQERRDPIGGETGIGERRPNVGVARQDPAPENLAPVGRILLAKAAQRGIRIGDQLRLSRIARGHCRMRSPRGSQSGSAVTRPSSHSPKNSMATAVPGLASSAGRYA